jgi:proteasome accessory factor B
MHRIYKIHASIRSGALPNCSTLAQSLEVDRKTIQRDISFMRDTLGLSVVYCDDLHGYRYDGDVADFPVFQISAEELATLFFTHTALQGVRGTRLADALGTAFANITRNMLGRIQFTWSDLDEAFSHKSVQQDPSQIKPSGQLAKAILDQTETAFNYHKLAGKSADPRKVRPLHLGEVEGGWYLIAHDLDRGALRTFALPRMSRVQVLQTRFERPEGFNGTAYLNKSFSLPSHSVSQTICIIQSPRQFALSRRISREIIQSPRQFALSRRISREIAAARADALAGAGGWLGAQLLAVIGSSQGRGVGSDRSCGTAAIL